MMKKTKIFEIRATEAMILMMNLGAVGVTGLTAKTGAAGVMGLMAVVAGIQKKSSTLLQVRSNSLELPCWIP